MAKYVVSYQLIGDVEQVKKKYEAEASFFLPADENVAKPDKKVKFEPVASPSKTLPAQTGAEGRVGTNVNMWTYTPALSSIEHAQSYDDPHVISSQLKGSYKSAHPVLLPNQFDCEPAHQRYDKCICVSLFFN